MGRWDWVFIAPEADLFDIDSRVVGKHYAGPTWESVVDGSKVVGKVVARSDSPNADTIPLLLLQTVERSASGMFSGVKSVQRLDTRGGGKPPAEGCDASRAGQVTKVPYTATYVFSRAM